MTICGPKEEVDFNDVEAKFAEEKMARRFAKWLKRLPGDWVSNLKKKFKQKINNLFYLKFFFIYILL